MSDTRPLTLIRGGQTADRNDAPTDFASLVQHAQAEEKAGRRAAARIAYERSLYAISTEEDARQVSSIVRWIARTFYTDGDADAALDCLEAALAIAEVWGDDAAAGHALNVQAVVSWQRGDMDDAERLYLMARSRAIRAGDAKLAAMTAQNLGVLANIRGDFAVAEHQYRASLADYRSLGLTADICVALNNLGILYIAMERWPEAEAALMEGAQICERTGDSVARTQLDINLAELWVAREEYVRAHGAVRKALAAAVQNGDGSAIGKATKLLGVIASETGTYDEAERHFLRADEVATARGEVLLQAEIARDRATLARRMGRNRDVLQQLNRAHRLFTQLRAQPELRDIGSRVGQLEQEFVHVARRWGESIEAKDRYTQGHCQRVAELACAIATEGGFDETSLFWFRIGALLHDVGKLVIPPEVLNKPGKLDDEEWALMKSHTTAGAEMIADIDFPWDVRPMVESHHERWDGKGYPHGLAGEDIPLIARILTIADVYDALTSVRSYKRAWTHQETMDILRKDVGTVFDPAVFAWFESVATDWPSRLAHLAGESRTTVPADEVSARDAASGELDDLTGVPMRRAFRETSERVLEARRTTGRPVSMLVIDIDHFKVVNDTFGHLAGDEVLKRVTAHLRGCVRPTDYIARYAGDEFVVLLPGTRLEDACAVAERLRLAVAEDSITGDSPASTGHVTLSIGVACAPQHGETMEALFGAADNALYGAKRAGRNAVTSAARLGVGRQEVVLQSFVGRHEERQRLRDLFANAVAGDPHVAVLVGEAGIGKSTLLKQLGPDIGIRAGAFLVGQCLESSASSPYGAWVDVIVGAHRAGLVPARSWKQLHRLVPELASDAQRGKTAEGSQRELLDELEEFLRIASSTRPLMVMLDDMQWADPASWDALEFLLSRLSEQRLLLCVTIRPEDQTDASAARLRRLSRSERCSEMQLSRLTRGDLSMWLRNSIGGQTPPEALLDFVMTQSEGNAFFAVQTVRALVEDGRLKAGVDGWQCDIGSGESVPRAIGDLLGRRVDGLTVAQREILALAAVLGREFDPEVLVAAYEGAEGDVHDALDEGLASAVLVSTTRARPTLAFTHAVLMRVLLTSLNPLRRRRLHERAARALESSSTRDAFALAVHFDQAGLSREAYRTAFDAGAQAQSLFAFESAAERYRIAKRHAQDSLESADVEWRLAQVEESAGQLAQAEVHCEQLLQHHADGAIPLGVLPAARRMRERLRLQRGAPVADVIAACERLLADARRVEQMDEVIALLIMLSACQQRLGQIALAEQLAREAVECAEPMGARSLGADAVMRLGSVLLASSPASAVPHYRRALDLFVRLGDRSGQLRCHINIGTACDRAGNHPAAEVSYLTALEIGTELRSADLSGAASLNLGVLLLKTGRLDTARTRFNEALAQFASIGHDPYRLASLYNLAHLARAENDAAGALELYDACVLLARTVGHHEIEIGATAGAGLAELDLHSTRGAIVHRDRAHALVGAREDWFQGRELLEALNIRLAIHERSLGDARRTLVDRLPEVEAYDAYAAMWLGAECAQLLDTSETIASGVRDRLVVQARALGYAPLVDRLAIDQIRRRSGSHAAIRAA